MPCICQLFGKNKCLIKSHTTIPSEIREAEETSSKVSATEVSRLKAEIWCLRNSLEDSVHANNNMQELIKNVVQEKYDVLEELNKIVEANEILEAQLRTERDIYAEEKKHLMEEVTSLQEKSTQDSDLIDKLIKQNIELKTSLLEANDTIYKMGLLYLKKRFTVPFK